MPVANDEPFKSPEAKIPARPPSTTKPKINLSGKPNAFSKPGMIVKKKFEMADVGPSDQDQRIMEAIEKAERERMELQVESIKQLAKPTFDPKKGFLKLQRPLDEVEESQTSLLSKVKDDFAAPVKIVKATKQDLVERKMNPS